MPTNRWGPPTWKFIHTIIVKIKEEHFERILPQLYVFIVRICTFLPCPECSQHATAFLREVNIKNIKSKDDLAKIFFVLHNMVNKRLGKPQFIDKNLHYYGSLSLINTYNQFSQNYHTHGNMSMITDSFHRRMIQRDLKQWIMANYGFFE